jgi:hypothetical protein
VKESQLKRQLVSSKARASSRPSNAREANEVYENRIDPGFSHGENVTWTAQWIWKSYTFITSPSTAYVRLGGVMGYGTARGQLRFDRIRLRPT